MATIGDRASQTREPNVTTAPGAECSHLRRVHVRQRRPSKRSGLYRCGPISS